MQRRVWLRLSLTCASVVAIGACAQVAGLGEFEKVACLDDCTDGGAEAATLIDSSSETATPLPDGSCPGTTTKCNNACVDTKTSMDHCGACGVACRSTETCESGACAVLPLGNGSDGPLAVAANATINTVRAGELSVTAGSRAATVATTDGFAAGELVMLHQTRGSGAGSYELGTIEQIDGAMKTITLARPAKNTFSSAGVARAQIVRVPQHTTVTVVAAATLTAPAWDGTTGGILVFKANGAVTIGGSIDMTGLGFRGFTHASSCAAGTRYACTAADTATGFAGESAAGPSATSNAANASGGGGGQDGQDCGGGAGGGHGTAGTSGPNGGGLVCRNGPQLGGAGGVIAGDPDLNLLLLFGGAGGEGGGDEDGAYPGAGGNGGGIVWIDAQTIAVTGAIRANGSAGANGVQTAAPCGGTGCGMGPGGGGAGGAIHLRADSSDVGKDLVTAAGTSGGACTCASSPGGTGGVGRIGIAGPVTGTTSPVFVAK